MKVLEELDVYSLVLLMVPLFCLTEGSNRFSDPDFKAVNFAEAIKDRKLNGSIFKDSEVTSEISCQFECISEDRCLSYNFLPILGKSTSKCQLSDSDRFIGRVNFTKEDGVLYRGVQVTRFYIYR